MSNLSEACKSCSVCWNGGIANHPRILGIYEPSYVPNPKVLVIDDMPHVATVDDWDMEAMEYEQHYWNRISFTRSVLSRLLGDIPYLYTQAIRCHSIVLRESPINPAIACSVWTHNLVSNKKLIITGQYGFNQMKLPSAKFKVFTLFRTARLGSVFTVPALDTMETDSEVDECGYKLHKVLKELNLK